MVESYGCVVDLKGVNPQLWVFDGEISGGLEQGDRERTGVRVDRLQLVLFFPV